MTSEQQSRPILNEPFGMFRAEYLNAAVYDLFAMPSYFPELETHRPCILLGGRGTGKTTVLKCLSYDGKDRLEQRQPTPKPPSEWPYFGFYYKVNTNRVTAFRGPELTERKWAQIFAHYVNMMLCNELLKFANWYLDRDEKATTLPSEICLDISSSLFVEPSNTQLELATNTRNGLRRFENLLNNLSSTKLPELSIQGKPVDELSEALLNLPQFRGKSFFFVIDEYENLLDYQQEIFNTLIKHCGDFYTFKVGVKELGWRRRTTHNSSEQLISPADYERIDISQRLDTDTFKDFAESVCLLRAKEAPELSNITSLDQLLPALSSQEEAERLGVSVIAEKIREKYIADYGLDENLTQISDLELYFAEFWADNKQETLKSVLNYRKSHKRKWKERYENYRFSMLFTIKSKKSEISKYYCGWNTYVLLSNGNIRYLLELINRAIYFNLKHSTNTLPISHEIQTTAAISVAKKNLSELEGLSVNGAQLTKLLLGLGRVFETFASNPKHHAPEYTQFHFADNETIPDEVLNLLDSAVMHLALVRTASNKRMELETKSWDYAIHPIFAPFFEYSHRRKRKFQINSTQFLGLISEPKKWIKEIVSKHGVEEAEDYPQQMQLFEAFYSHDS